MALYGNLGFFLYLSSTVPYTRYGTDAVSYRMVLYRTTILVKFE